jgi:hypothetical protein
MEKEKKLVGSVFIPFVRDISEKFKYTGNHYNIRTISKTIHTIM